jgi:hypothetical protein
MDREIEVLIEILEHIEMGLNGIEEGHAIEALMELCFLKGFVKEEIENLNCKRKTIAFF